MKLSFNFEMGRSKTQERALNAETSIATVTPTTNDTERTTDRIFAILFIVITNFSFNKICTKMYILY